MFKVLRPLMIIAFLLVVGVVPVLADGAVSADVYLADVKPPTVPVDTTLTSCSPGIIPELMAPGIPGGVYLVDSKVRPVVLIGLDRFARLGLDVVYCVE